MNNMFKIALTVVLGAAIAAPAFAQDMYKDVPENHWAYEAIARLRKDGILVDDGSGKFLGRCTVTRYEMAVTIDRLYRVVLAKFADQQSQIDALKTKLDNAPAGTPGTDFQPQIDALKAQIAGMHDYGPDIQELQKLTNDFQKELSALGSNVDEMKSKLASLDDRVSALEKHKSTIDISARVDLGILAGNSQDDKFGIMHDGTLTGFDRRTNGPVGMTKDTTTLHQMALHLNSNTDDGPKVKSTLIIGNTLSALGPDSAPRQDSFPANSSFPDPATDVYFQELNATWNANLAGQGVSATVGRFGWKLGKYLYSRPAYTEQYWMDPYRDNGEYTIDGANIGFGFGKASANVVYGRTSDFRSTNNITVDQTGRFTPADSTFGVALSFPIGDTSKINLAYLLHDSMTDVATGGGPANRIQTYGGDAKFKVSNIDFGAAWSKGEVRENNSSVTGLDSDNTAWDVNAHFTVLDKVKVGGGWRRVEKNFAASADTGRFGTFWTPRNFEGFNADVKFSAGPTVDLYGKGEFVHALSDIGGAFPLNQIGSNVKSWEVGAHVKMNDAFGLMLSYEDVTFSDPNFVNDAKEKWYTIGFGYDMTSRSKLTFKYIYSDADLNGRTGIGGSAGSGLPAGGAGTPYTGSYRGGLLATQLTVRF